MGKYFTIEELCKTSTKLENVPNELQKNNIIRLIEVLDVIREEWTIICNNNEWGNPAILVNSGFRSKIVNDKVKGSKSSEHLLGFAVDFEPINGRNKEFWDFMVKWVKDKNIQFSQLINEKPINGVPSWIHFSINGYKGYRCEILTIG